MKTRKGRSKEYLVRWEDFSPVYNLWQLEENLSNVPDLIEQFWSSKKSKVIILSPKMNLEEKF
jgi:hypothetical protein